MTVARWRSQGWRSLQQEPQHPLEAARDHLDDELHDRMPVILEPERFEAWLTGTSCLELLKPAANDVLQCWPVSRRVNSSRAPDDDASLIEAVAAGAGGNVQQVFV